MAVNQVLPFTGNSAAVAPATSKTSRYLVAFFPTFALERCGYLVSECVVLCCFRRNAFRLIGLMPAARDAGLTLGMSVSEARALCPRVILENWCEEDEEKDWTALQGIFSAYSDRIQRGRDADLVLDVSGTAHLFGGEERLVRLIVEHSEKLGHVCRAVIGDDPLAAEIWARSQGSGVLPVGQMALMLADLPFLSMRSSSTLHQAVQALDIETIGEWAALDPASVAGRYGQEGVRLHQLARGKIVFKGMGLCGAEYDITERVELPEPVRSWSLIEWALRGALERIVLLLEQRQQRVVRIRVHLLGDIGRSTVVRVRFGRPLREIETILRVCRHRMERVKLSSPVDVCLVEIEESAPEGRDQGDLLDRRRVGETLPEVVARLADGLGEQAVFQAIARASWRPEKAWTSVRLGEEHPRCPPLKKPDPVQIQQGERMVKPSPRPSVLLSRPTPLIVREKAGRPVQIKLEMHWFFVNRAEGPERICTEWWKEDGGIQRTYWTVAFGERIAWIFQNEHASWALHGWFG